MSWPLPFFVCVAQIPFDYRMKSINGQVLKFSIIVQVSRQIRLLSLIWYISYTK